MPGRPHEDVVAALDVPDPFDLDELIRRVAARRGRPIQLMPFDTAPGDPVGIWIATRTKDYICYEAATSKLHREHIILHELGHVLCGHKSTGDSAAALASLLMPSLDPAVVRRALARTVYSDPDERQAELFATVVLAGAGRATVSGAPAEVRALLARVEQAVG
jgi:hypothetical protein